jgi:hypothetical protein
MSFMAVEFQSVICWLEARSSRDCKQWIAIFNDVIQHATHVPAILLHITKLALRHDSLTEAP